MPAPSTSDATLRRSPGAFRLFRWYARHYLARGFHAVRISRTGPIPALPDRPVVVVLNHASWWDPLVAMALTSELPGDRVHYAPIESIGLAQYPFFEKLGFFGIETSTRAGAARFLRTGLAVLERPEVMLWITAQGTFVDPRDRPMRLRPGIGHLAHRLVDSVIWTLAIEYPFWNDRCPEALLRFGQPIAIRDGSTARPREWTAAIERSLEESQDALAAEARRRDPDAFSVLIGGTAGVGGVYDGWRRMRAWLGGRTFRPEHAIRATDSPDDRKLHVIDGRNTLE